MAPDANGRASAEREGLDGALGWLSTAETRKSRREEGRPEGRSSSLQGMRSGLEEPGNAKAPSRLTCEGDEEGLFDEDVAVVHRRDLDRQV